MVDIDKMGITNINVKSIFIGFLMVWVTSFGSGLLIGIILRLLSLDEVIQILMTPLGSQCFAIVMGVWGSIVGGYTTGLIAKKSIILNALLAGVLTVAVSMIYQWKGPVIAEITKEAVIIPSVILGGWLALKISSQHLHAIADSGGSE
jgi:cation transporter-like permease